MTSILAIDPGTTESAWVLLRDHNPSGGFGKEPNEAVLERVGTMVADRLAIEMVASYGMAVGAEVFGTCVWAGRFIQRWMDHALGDPGPLLVYRKDVKQHLCGTQQAKDSNVRQALIDMYGPGKDVAVGVKKAPGPLYGMRADVWQALGVAVTAAHLLELAAVPNRDGRFTHHIRPDLEATP